MQLIDTHVHLNFDIFQPDLSEVRSRWLEAGVIRLVHSCVEPSEYESIKAIASQFPEVSFAIGLHPLDASKWDSSMGKQVKKLASSHPKVVAIGETGLDFYKADNIQEQLTAFADQIEIACELNLPLIIHCRDAASQVHQVLQSHKATAGERLRGVMHCWGGNPEETQWFLDLGFYISFSGTVTFKNAHPIHASAQMVPSDRLLIETDCPFLAPVPKRGQKRNEPAYVQYVAEHIALLRQTSVEEISQQTTLNACKVFGLSLT